MKTTGIIFALLLAAVTQAQPSRLDGEWKLDAAASDFGRAELPRAFELSVASQGGRIEMSYASQDSERVHRTVSTDGKAAPTGATQNETAAANWISDGLFMVVEGDNHSVVYEYWKASADGSILTRVQHHPDASAADDSRLTFRKVRN
jgi:hypothetical protein